VPQRITTQWDQRARAPARITSRCRDRVPGIVRPRGHRGGRLASPDGRPIKRENYGGVIFGDPGNKAGSNDPIIPVETRDIGGNQTNLTDLYAVRIALDGFHGVTTVGGELVWSMLPDFTRDTGAVKSGEVELGPVGVALKATKAAAVWRNIKVA